MAGYNKKTIIIISKIIFFLLFAVGLAAISINYEIIMADYPVFLGYKLTWFGSYFNSLLLLLILAALLWEKDIVFSVGKILRVINKLPDNLLLIFFSGLFLALTSFLSWKLFGNLPHVADSHAQYAGAKIFASGKFYEISHPIKAVFDALWFVNDGKYYPMYPPGHMLLLAVGHLINTPWIINPLLGTLSLIAIFFLAREIAGREAARYSLLLTLCSPFIVFMSSEYMNHATAMFMLTVFALFYIRAIKYQDWLSALIAGISMSYLIITRPQTAVAAGLPFAIHIIWNFFTKFKNRKKITLWIILGMLPLIIFFLYYNQQTTGDALTTGYQKYCDEGVWKCGGKVMPGSKILSEGLGSYVNDLERAKVQLRGFDMGLFHWMIPSLLLPQLLFIFRKQTPYCNLLAFSLLSVLFGLTLTQYAFTNLFGPRYLYEISGFMIVLTAAALVKLPEAILKYEKLKLSKEHFRGLIAIALIALISTGLVFNTSKLYKVYANNYWEGNVGWYKSIISKVKKPAVVLVSDGRQLINIEFTMPPNDADPVIFGHDYGASNIEVIRYYPQRYVYYIKKDIPVLIYKPVKN